MCNFGLACACVCACVCVCARVHLKIGDDATVSLRAFMSLYPVSLTCFVFIWLITYRCCKSKGKQHTFSGLVKDGT